MFKLILSQGILLAATLLALNPAYGARPQHFTADYKAQFNDISVNATRSLTTLANGEQLLSFKAETWLASLSETSQFQWTDMDVLVPQKYLYRRSIIGKKREAILDFNWQAKTVVNNVQDKPWSMAIPELVQDKLSYQLQLRSDLINNKPTFKYAIADGGHLKTYLFEVIGEELLNTPLGKLQTVKIKKIRAQGKQRTTYIWMAKNWDYLLVKLEQTESDGKSYAIHLLNAQVAGQQVKPSAQPLRHTPAAAKAGNTDPASDMQPLAANES